MAKSREVAQEQEATDEQLEKEREVSTGDEQGGSVSESEKSEQDAFREEQKARAAEQGLTSDRAVPESRDPAFAQSNAVESDITKKQREMGLLDPEPMPQSAYDAAEDEGRQKKTAEEGLVEAIKVADYIEVTDESSAYHKQRGSVVRLVFTNEDHSQRSGQPEQRFIQPLEFEARSIGGPVGDATMMLRPDQVRKISEREWIGAA